MQRVARRRDYMINTLGYELNACVLPLGNTSGWLAPYVTNLSLALTHTDAEHREQHRITVRCVAESADCWRKWVTLGA